MAPTAEILNCMKLYCNSNNKLITTFRCISAIIPWGIFSGLLVLKWQTLDKGSHSQRECVTLLKPHKNHQLWTKDTVGGIHFFFLIRPFQLWVVISSSWTSHIFISATGSIKEGNIKGALLSAEPAYFLTVMHILMTRNYISCTGTHLERLWFHLVIFFFLSEFV